MIRFAVDGLWKKKALQYIMYCSQHPKVIESSYFCFCAAFLGGEAEDAVNVVDARFCDRFSTPDCGVFPRRALRSR